MKELWRKSPSEFLLFFPQPELRSQRVRFILQLVQTQFRNALHADLHDKRSLKELFTIKYACVCQKQGKARSEWLCSGPLLIPSHLRSLSLIH